MFADTRSSTPESRAMDARRLAIRLRRLHTERIARGAYVNTEIVHVPGLTEVDPWLIVAAYEILVDDLMTDFM